MKRKRTPIQTISKYPTTKLTNQTNLNSVFNNTNSGNIYLIKYSKFNEYPDKCSNNIEVFY